MTPQEDASPRATPQPVRGGLVWRLVTSAIGIPLLLAVIYVGGPLYVAVVAVALAAGVFEFVRALKVGDNGLTLVAIAGTAALAGAAAWSSAAVAGALSLSVAASLVVLVLSGEVPVRLPAWGLALAGLLYVGLLGQHFVALRELAEGRDWVLLALFTTFATDTGAYAVGRFIGRHKLAPTISPGKTVEGAVGGLVAGAVAAWALARVLGLDQPVVAMLVLGAVAAVAGQLGDLAESLIKRSAGVKDMGTLLPGHGGVLDRLDSLLFVVPLVYYVARWWST